ncbi:MAG TPA: glutamyl-tRNA reductase [Solirubrobacteraceae bacterium]
MSEVLCLGISHKTAPVALRERVAMDETQAERFAREAVAAPAVDEAVVISTCNRTEVLATTHDPVAAETAILGMLATRAGIRPTELADVIYSPRNCDAARHLYRVTAGLESMIVGEAEVQGQVKRAFEIAKAAGATGPLLNRLFAAALQTGKRARTETAIGAGGASVSSVAVDLARDLLGDLRERRVVVIGAGETSELTARALHEQGVAAVFFANRRADRARAIARRFGGHVVSFDDLPEHLERADIVVASTASPHPIVGAVELEVVMRRRAGRALLLIDIAVPRDIDPACADIEGVTLYDIDDLQAVVARNLEVREAEAARAEGIVEDEIQRFARWMGQADVRPTVAALRRHGEEIVEQVLAENAGRWDAASRRDVARVEAMARAVMQRLLHEPTIRLRESGHARVALVRELFGLDEAASAAPEEERPPADVRELRRP